MCSYLVKIDALRAWALSTVQCACALVREDGVACCATLVHSFSG
jgi:hypothetical protein